jgi:hypothetical protein
VLTCSSSKAELMSIRKSGVDSVDSVKIVASEHST